MILVVTWIYLLCRVSAAVTRNRARSGGSDETIKGVSLGGWLVTEPFITPSLYRKANSEVDSSLVSIVDEYTLCTYLGYPEAKRLLSDHFASFVTEKDFSEISANGFNLVRIPIGYWAWKTDASGAYEFEANATVGEPGNSMFWYDPYVSDGLQLQYLKSAFGWARKHELKVMVDVHGAPGSQNGFDNSGRRNLYGAPRFLNEQGSGELMQHVIRSLYQMINDGLQDTVVGVEIVNEPLASKLGEGKVLKFYYDSLGDFALAHSPQQSFVVHDAFEPIGFWDNHFSAEHRNVSAPFTNMSCDTMKAMDPLVLVDHHHYQVFTDQELVQSNNDRIQAVKNYGDALAREQRRSIVGEWSGAITDCARYLNGFGIGARYDGTYYKSTNFTSSLISGTNPVGACLSYLPINQWSDNYKAEVRRFIEAQLIAYTRATEGWIFWNWKTESAPEWDYKKLAC